MKLGFWFIWVRFIFAGLITGAFLGLVFSVEYIRRADHAFTFIEAIEQILILVFMISVILTTVYLVPAIVSSLFYRFLSGHKLQKPLTVLLTILLYTLMSYHFVFKGAQEHVQELASQKTIPIHVDAFQSSALLALSALIALIIAGVAIYLLNKKELKLAQQSDNSR